MSVNPSIVKAATSILLDLNPEIDNIGLDDSKRYPGIPIVIEFSYPSKSEKRKCLYYFNFYVNPSTGEWRTGGKYIADAMISYEDFVSIIREMDETGGFDENEIKDFAGIYDEDNFGILDDKVWFSIPSKLTSGAENVNVRGTEATLSKILLNIPNVRSMDNEFREVLIRFSDEFTEYLKDLN